MHETTAAIVQLPQFGEVVWQSDKLSELCKTFIGRNNFQFSDLIGGVLFYFQLWAAPEPDSSEPPAWLQTDQRPSGVLERDVIQGNPGPQVQPQLHQSQVGL